MNRPAEHLPAGTGGAYTYRNLLRLDGVGRDDPPCDGGRVEGPLGGPECPRERRSEHRAATDECDGGEDSGGDGGREEGVEVRLGLRRALEDEQPAGWRPGPEAGPDAQALGRKRDRPSNPESSQPIRGRALCETASQSPARKTYPTTYLLLQPAACIVHAQQYTYYSAQILSHGSTPRGSCCCLLPATDDGA